ncbi:MAG: DHH family phosphoesterase [Candidatus Woesearchaeota archaeon]
MRQNYQIRDRQINTAPIQTEFIANHAILEPLKEKMTAVARRIRTAVNEKQRIVIKHHNDTDGFCSGLVLEQAIIPLIEAVNFKKQAVWEKFKRMPSVTPFLNIEDATKDIAQFLLVGQRFQEEKPLIILTDLGSGSENILPLKMLKTFNCEIIVIDHHPVDPTVLELVDYHINPMEFDAPSSLCAGVLCCEVAKMIEKNVERVELICAISSYADHVETLYAQPYYDKANIPLEYLKQIGDVIDFTVFNLRNLDGKELLQVLLGSDEKKQRELVQLLAKELQVRKDKILTQAHNLISEKETQAHRYIILPISEISLRDMYPRLGKIVEIVHSHYGEKEKPLITMGITSNSVTFRVEDGSQFNFQTMLEQLQQKAPDAFIEGGGHPYAGTFRCQEAKFEAVFSLVKEYIESL